MKRRHGPSRLRVYALAEQLVKLVEVILEMGLVQAHAVDQLRRTTQSVVLNIAEGAGHFSPGRKVYYYQIARGAAEECIAILRKVRGDHPVPIVHLAIRTANMVCVLLTGLIRRHEGRRDGSE